MYEHLNYIQIPRGRDYQPALTIQRVSSKGQSARVLGIKTGRQHEFLSRNEQDYFYIAEFCDSVIDIREQFPMNMDKTLFIAEQLGLKHPVNPKTQMPICMTSDFCITIRSGSMTKDIIRTIKPVTELVHRRTLEKYEIERKYWEQLGLDWGIVTDREIHKTVAKNIRAIRDAYSLTDFEEFQSLDKSMLNAYKLELSRRLIYEEDTTRKVIHSFAIDYQLPVGTCITLFWHLLATKVLFFKLGEELNLNSFNKLNMNHADIDELLLAEYQEAK